MQIVVQSANGRAAMHCKYIESHASLYGYRP